MFLNREIELLENLINSSITVQDVLTDDEQQAIRESRQKLENIKEKIIVPNHSRSVKTITLVKLITDTFDCADFIGEILDSLKPLYEIRVGFSFTMISGNRLSYVMAIPGRPINNENRVISDAEDEVKLFDSFKGFTRQELLDYAFQQRNETNPFEKSGYIPGKLVTLNIWITKYPV